MQGLELKAAHKRVTGTAEVLTCRSGVQEGLYLVNAIHITPVAHNFAKLEPHHECEVYLQTR